ncbi:MAG: hypothetical protein Q4C95_01290 [Planctomycetia bacterium]|nr:hypothetical protein [Planctomycetia bacterium]
MKSFILTLVLSFLILGMNQLEAQEDAAATPAAQQAADAPVSEPVPQATETPVTEAAPSSTTALAKEKESLEKSPAVKEGLSILKEFKRRLPNYYRSLNISKKQVSDIYAIQKEYFDIIILLQARLERLEAERDAAVLNVLTEEQKTILQQKTDEAKKNREDKKKADNSDK